MDKEKAKRSVKQVAKNVGAVAGGTALGYLGTGLLAKKALNSRTVRRRLSRMSAADRRKFKNTAKTGVELAGSGVTGLTSIAINDALKDNEKTASFFTKYCIGLL